MRYKKEVRSIYMEIPSYNLRERKGKGKKGRKKERKNERKKESKQERKKKERKEKERKEKERKKGRFTSDFLIKLIQRYGKMDLFIFFKEVRHSCCA